jgi:hypothetical protein
VKLRRKVPNGVEKRWAAMVAAESLGACPLFLTHLVVAAPGMRGAVDAVIGTVKAMASL